MKIHQVLLIIFLVILFLIGFLSWYTIDQGDRGVVLRWGAVKSISEPGLHFRVPFVDNIDSISVRTQTLTWGDENVMQSYSMDQQPADLRVRLTWSVKKDIDSIIQLYSQYKSTKNFENAVVIPRSEAKIKAVFGQFNAVNAVRDRSSLNSESFDAMAFALFETPGQLESVEIQNIDFSDAYELSIEARMQAEVEVQKIKQNLERERTNAEIKVVQAKANAEAVELQGRAEALAIKARGDALRDNPALIHLQAVERWNGVLPVTMVPNSAVPFLDLPIK